jgi:hypothetical protein
VEERRKFRVSVLAVMRPEGFGRIMAEVPQKCVLPSGVPGHKSLHVKDHIADQDELRALDLALR